MADHELFINGERVPAEGGRAYDSINPATEEAWTSVAAASAADVDKAVEAARGALHSPAWSGMSRAERGELLIKVSLLVQERMDDLVMAEVQDSGGTFRKGYTADITATADTFRYYGELIAELEPDRVEEADYPVPSRNLICREPFGVVGAIVPFNFPLASASWKVAPALAAGCAMVLKPSPYTPVTALMLGEICAEAGVPAGVLNVVAGPSHEVGARIVSHPGVDKIAFTGSPEVGSRIMAACAPTTKPLVLELGGKSANIILEDAPMDSVIPVSLFGTFFHGGQVCDSGTRILVHRSRYDEVVQRLVAGTQRIVIGDPMDPATTMGPLVSAPQRARTEKYVQIALDEGAVCAAGGNRPSGLNVGYFHEPTIFAGVKNSMRIAREEVFGPVVVVIPFDNDDEAIRVANDSEYGLGGAVWSSDIDRAVALARRVQAGTVWVNDYHLLSPRFPFGGYKRSGFGRELGPEGLSEYQQIKHIHVGQATGPEEKYYTGLLLDDL